MSEFCKIQFSEKQLELFSGLRSKMYDIVTYLDVETVKSILDSTNTQKYAFIVHDKDLNEYGEFKKTHIHIVFVDDTRRRAIRLCRLFNTTELRAITNSQQLVGSFKYLTHESKKALEEKKVIYDKSNIISNDLEWFNSFGDDLSDCVDNSMNIINDIISSTKIRDMVKKYGREFIYHYKSYKEVAHDIEVEEHEKRLARLSLTDIESGEIIQGGFLNGKQIN